MREAGEADLLVIFTDGSAEEGVRRGGAGVYGGEQLLHSWSGAAGAACSSYVAERTAKIEAVRWLEEDAPPWSSAVIATNSRSQVDALGGAGAEPHVTALRRALWSLEEKGRSVTLVWVPGHCGVPGNEEEEEIPIDGSTRRALIRREVRGSPVRYERLREVYTGELREAEKAQLPRADRVNLTRFRTGVGDAQDHPETPRWLTTTTTTSPAKTDSGNPFHIRTQDRLINIIFYVESKSTICLWMSHVVFELRRVKITRKIFRFVQKYKFR